MRRALNLGVDVETVLKTAYAERGVRAAGAIPPGIMGYDSTRAPYPWDTAQARRLLREAGYGNGFSVRLWRNRRAEFARIAQSVQQDLALLGIKVEIVERDAPSVRATVRNGEADLYTWATGTPITPIPRTSATHSFTPPTGAPAATTPFYPTLSLTR